MSLIFRKEKAFYPIVCSDCGQSDQVPFKPDPTRPVFCKACHQKRVEAKQQSHKQNDQFSWSRRRQNE